MNKKKVSIILPVFNGEKYLSQSIDSIICQSYQNIELIIVDDCSTDSTWSIINEYENRDDRIKGFQNKENSKLPKTLNAGFEKASGDYLSWTSDDNMYQVDAIERMVQVLDEHNDCGLVYADFSYIDADNNPAGHPSYWEPDEIPFVNMVGACFLYRKENADLAGEYDPEMFLAEDYEYWIRMHKTGRFFHLEKDLYLYRIHEGSLSSTKKKNVEMQVYKVLEKHIDYLYSVAKKNKRHFEFLQRVEAIGGCLESEKTKSRDLVRKKDRKYVFYLFFSRIKTFFCRCIEKTREIIK